SKQNKDTRESKMNAGQQFIPTPETSNSHSPITSSTSVNTEQQFPVTSSSEQIEAEQQILLNFYPPLGESNQFFSEILPQGFTIITEHQEFGEGYSPVT